MPEKDTVLKCLEFAKNTKYYTCTLQNYRSSFIMINFHKYFGRDILLTRL